MFTGLVEAIGTVATVSGPSKASSDAALPRRLRIATSIADAVDTAKAHAPMRPVGLGDSVAIDGCCLTVVDIEPGHLSFEAATETLARTSLGQLKAGDRVHLERALCFGDRLGGHLVSGHVDAVGSITHREMRGSGLYLTIQAPDAVARLTAGRGSITVAGVSLTVTEVVGNALSVMLIPHTLAHTTLGALDAGDAVNLEADLIARYVERLLAHPSHSHPQADDVLPQAASQSPRPIHGV